MTMVYFNLSISYEHPELAAAYHQLCAELIESFGTSAGKNLVREIERIAAERRELIANNLEEAKDPKNIKGGVNKVLIKGNITQWDLLYTAKYWEKVAAGELPKKEPAS